MRLSKQKELPPRRWYLDALSSLAFLLLGIFLVRPLKIVPIVAAVVVLFHLGMAYFFGRSALRGLAKERV